MKSILNGYSEPLDKPNKNAGYPVMDYHPIIEIFLVALC